MDTQTSFKLLDTEANHSIGEHFIRRVLLQQPVPYPVPTCVASSVKRYTFSTLKRGRDETRC